MKSFFLLALLVGSGLGYPAAASIHSSDPTIIVRYDDLDLSSPAGKAKLEGRLKRAVRNVCDEPGPKLTESLKRMTACMDEAWRDALRQIP